MKNLFKNEFDFSELQSTLYKNWSSLLSIYDKTEDEIVKKEIGKVMDSLLDTADWVQQHQEFRELFEMDKEED